VIAFETGLLGVGHGGIGREAISLFAALEQSDEVIALTWRDGHSQLEPAVKQRISRKLAMAFTYVTGRSWRLRTPSGSMLLLPQVLPFTGRGTIVVRLHDLFPLTNPEWFTDRSVKLFAHSLRNLVRNGAYFLCDSETSESELLRLYPAARSLGVVHCYIPPLKSALECGTCHGCTFDFSSKFFLSVGTVEPRKNYPFLISLVRKYPQFRIAVVGRPGWKSEETLHNLRTTPGISYLEYICDGALKKLYSSAHAFLSPSLSEGFNIPACEAEQFGLPVLLSDIAVHRELHPEEELLPLGDIDIWKSAMTINFVKREPKVFPTFEEYAVEIVKSVKSGSIR
jgi:glycosyltransferase involved in cell wall biosynthesis